jgi:hypothetical protein
MECQRDAVPRCRRVAHSSDVVVLVSGSALERCHPCFAADRHQLSCAMYGASLINA